LHIKRATFIFFEVVVISLLVFCESSIALHVHENRRRRFRIPFKLYSFSLLVQRNEKQKKRPPSSHVAPKILDLWTDAMALNYFQGFNNFFTAMSSPPRRRTGPYNGLQGQYSTLVNNGHDLMTSLSVLTRTRERAYFFIFISKSRGFHIGCR